MLWEEYQQIWNANKSCGQHQFVRTYPSVLIWDRWGEERVFELARCHNRWNGQYGVAFVTVIRVCTSGEKIKNMIIIIILFFVELFGYQISVSVWIWLFFQNCSRFQFGFGWVSVNRIRFGKPKLVWFRFGFGPGLVNRNWLGYIVPLLVRAYSQLGSRN